MENYQTKTSSLISVSYLQLQDMVSKLSELTDSLMHTHQQDFVTAYKDHMLKVQCEMIHLKKKSTDFYQKMKRDERIRFLESTIQWLRGEALSLAKNISDLKIKNDEMKEELDIAKSDKIFMLQYTKSQKRYNQILVKTIDKLKSPKYQEQYQLNQSRLIQNEQDLTSVQSATIVNHTNLHNQLRASKDFELKSPIQSIGKKLSSTLFEKNRQDARASTAYQTVRKSSQNNEQSTIDPSILNNSKTSQYRFRDRNRKAFVSMSVNSAPYQTVLSESKKDNFETVIANQNQLNYTGVASQGLGFENIKISNQLIRQQKIQNERLISKLHEDVKQKDEIIRDLKAKLNEHIETQCNQQDQQNNDIKSLHYSQKLDLKDFFLECVQSVLAFNQRFGQTQFTPLDRHNTISDLNEKHLRHMTHIEKREAIYRFLNNKRVLRGLYDLIFPSGYSTNMTQQLDSSMKLIGSDFIESLSKTQVQPTPVRSRKSSIHTQNHNKTQSFIDKIEERLVEKKTSNELPIHQQKQDKRRRSSINNYKLLDEYDLKSEEQFLIIEPKKIVQTANNYRLNSIKNKDHAKKTYQVKNGKLMISQ
ncbi:UNKNOWN [Stylonychia lemnae]|uniref:Uncharacterized protein n=1 Tax=Stylonychia lemnae TaxID=5949 RepID=A0A078ACW1_STYLE|nr:UNKNOWN [Stylonychia lemnae]|eukprot:CDW79701.1 UNKNOWN [Stylonychia lemnae]